MQKEKKETSLCHETLKTDTNKYLEIKMKTNRYLYTCCRQESEIVET